MQAFTNFSAQTAGVFIGAALLFLSSLVLVFVWATFFVSYLGYDYVTVSNVLFFTSILLPFINAIVSIIARQDNWAITAFSGIIVYPFVLSSAFLVYEHFRHPAISAQINWLGDYRAAAGVPLALLGSAISNIGPLGSSIARTIEASPLLMLIANAIIGQIVVIVFNQLFSRRTPPAKPAVAA